MMSDSFKNEKNFIVKRSDLNFDMNLTVNSIEFKLRIKSLEVLIDPQIIDDMATFSFTSQQFYLMRDLK